MIPENVVTTQHGPLSEELLNSPNQDGPKTPMKIAIQLTISLKIDFDNSHHGVYKDLFNFSLFV